MGGVFSRDENLNHIFDGDYRGPSIQSRLESIEESLRQANSRADTNGDGVVSRKEMESYLSSQLQVREDELLRLRNELERVQNEYEALSKKHSKLISDLSNDSVADSNDLSIVKSKVSDEAIESFVQSLIDDPNVNIHGFPDRIEKAMYKRLTKMALVSLEKTIDNVSFEMIGHKVQLVMRPTQE